MLNQLSESEFQLNSTDSFNEQGNFITNSETQLQSSLSSSHAMSMYPEYNSTSLLDTFSYDLENLPDELMPTSFDALNTSEHEGRNEFTGHQYIYYANPDGECDHLVRSQATSVYSNNFSFSSPNSSSTVS